jgi:AraC-like DNA-binding protein
MLSLPVWPINLDSPPVIAIVAARSAAHRGTQQFLLPRLWAMHFYEYDASFTIAGHSHEIRPGCVSVIPPDQVVTYHWPHISGHAYAHFFLPAAPQGFKALNTIAVVQNLEDRFDTLHQQFLEAAAWGQQQPRRAAARLWDILFTLANPKQLPTSFNQCDAPLTHPAVLRATQFIKMHLSKPLRVAQITDDADISANHLNRLFHQAYGTTITEYVRRQRILHATHWLKHTTLPIKQIAIEVGVPDLQRFNKLIRHHAAMSPRQVRQQ